MQHCNHFTHLTLSKYSRITFLSSKVLLTKEDHASHHHPAIHRQHLARDVAGGRAGQEQHRVGDVFRLAKTVERDLLQNLTPRIFLQPARHVRLDKARRDGVHRDAPRSELARDGLREPD